MKKRRVYKNQPEEAFCSFIEQQNYIPMKRGWPDFFCFRGDEIICVEVKNYNAQPLKKEQLQVMKFLVYKGINCFRWNFESQILEPITQSSVRR